MKKDTLDKYFPCFTTVVDIMAKHNLVGKAINGKIFIQSTCKSACEYYETKCPMPREWKLALYSNKNIRKLRNYQTFVATSCGIEMIVEELNAMHNLVSTKGLCLGKSSYGYE